MEYIEILQFIRHEYIHPQRRLHHRHGNARPGGAELTVWPAAPETTVVL
jgi:hypothetical protein